jgi:hypothetical protein
MVSPHMPGGGLDDVDQAGRQGSPVARRSPSQWWNLLKDDPGLFPDRLAVDVDDSVIRRSMSFLVLSGSSRPSYSFTSM